MQVNQSVQHLDRVLLADRFSKTAIPHAKISDGAPRHILQVDAEDIIVGDLAPIIRHDMLMLEKLEPVDFLLQCFDF